VAFLDNPGDLASLYRHSKIAAELMCTDC